MRALVIDDDELVRGTLSLVLRASGYDCTTASSALTGIALAEAGGFAIALIDVNMPGLNGFEAVKAIRRVIPPVAIVVMSGRPGANGQEYPALAKGMGAHSFLLKPFTRNKLLDALQDALKAKGRGKWRTHG